MPHAVEVAGLRKVYGEKRAVDGLDLHVAHGEVVAILGPNGAGKTTTVEILEGYRSRDGGDVRVLGRDPQDGDRAWRSRLGIVLQSNNDLAEATVAELVRHFARFFPDPRDPDEVIDVRRAAGQGADARAAALRRSAAAARRRPRHRRPARAAVPRRADHGVRPAGPALVLGPGRAARGRRHDDPADDPLPGGGRAPRRPGRGRARRSGRRGGRHRRTSAGRTARAGGGALDAGRAGARGPHRHPDADGRRADRARWAARSPGCRCCARRSRTCT